ncbi:rRNA maturation RNase YbeY [Candidatus Gracilibacteria bacterium]|nr:rRNA maturation RNase YbeY [Candidatus Gracilibacteria bacterium]
MFKYKFINKPKDLKLKKEIIELIFKSVSENINKSQNGTVNIVFVDDKQMQELNKNYRNIDTTTDVLSFHYFEDFSSLKQKEIAGEIILSQNKIISQSKEYGLTEEQETYKLITHSILHILGFDHETDEDYAEMSEEEEKVLRVIY